MNLKTKAPQSLEAFYHHHLHSVPDTIGTEVGHFDVFQRNSFPGPQAESIPYSRKEFYKISLFTGENKISYADRTFKIEKNALLFVNPQIPYGLELIGEEQSGFFCVFSESFFAENTSAIRQFPLFQPGGIPLFNLTDEQATEVTKIFRRMQHENGADFRYKNDILRNLIMELIFIALKMIPPKIKPYGPVKGATRLAAVFFELLEKQFPIVSPRRVMELRNPVSFAEKLSVHVNYLNRSVKKVCDKTTSQLITERLVQEAKGLLIRTDWNISEIAWSLGFKGLPHFITCFKKHTLVTPKKYRMNTGRIRNDNP